MMPLLFVQPLLQQPPLVTLEQKTIRLENFAPILSKALGEPIVIATPLLNDTITISVKDISKSDLMRRLATLANATWSQKERFLLFEQTSEQQRAEKLFAESERYKRLAKSIEEAKKRVAKFTAFDENEAKSLKRELESLSKTKPAGEEGSYDRNYYGRIQRADARGPYNRFMKRLMSRITPDMMMPLSDDDRRVVYSNHPTAMQRPLKVRFDDLWAQLVNEQNIWADVTQSTPIKSGRDTEYISYGFSETAFRTNAVSNKIPTIQIRFTTDITGFNDSAQVALYDEKGSSISTSFESFNGINQEEAEELQKSMGEQKSVTKLKLSPEAEAYTKLESRSRIAKRPPIEKSLLEQLLNPEKYEATGQYQLEVLKWLGQNKNVIAYNLSELGETFGNLDNLKSPYLRKIVDLEETDNWLILTLRDRLAARKMSVDPRTIGPLIRLAHERDCVSIEEESEFAAKLPPNEMASYRLSRRINQVRPYDLPVNNDRAALRMYAFMDPPLRKLIFSGKVVPLQKLGDRFAREIYKAIFWADWANWDVDYQMFQKPNGGWSEEFNEIQTQVYGGLLSEPTNMCPNGLSGEMAVTGSESISEVLLMGPEASSQYPSIQQQDPNQLGQLLFQQKNPTKYPWANSPYQSFDKNSIRIVTSRSLTFKVTVRKGIAKSYSLREMHVTDPKIYTIDNLPERIKKQIEEGYKQAQESDKYYNTNPTQGGTPPPPSLF